MKYKFFPTLLLFACAGNILMAQSSRSFAVTGNTKGAVNWSFLREIDMSSASVMRNIYPIAQQSLIYDALTKLPIANNSIASPATSVVQGVTLEQAVPDLVAALAYDATFNRLYYTYMHGNELRYIDLNTPQPKQYVVRHAALKQFTSAEGEEDVITRMAFASDGYGYALTNNSNHLIRFSSGEKIVIKDLGALTDGKKNSNISVHNICSSYGGDLIGDAFGNLYLFTQKGNIFKINPNTMVADFAGAIKNLPQDFTVNGAAVDEQNNIIVSCATLANNYCTVNMNTLEAVVLPKKEDMVYNASDLANKNLLYQSKLTKNTVTTEVKGNSYITIFPNPVTTRSFDIQFGNIVKGDYSIELHDATGNLFLKKEVNLIPNQIERISLPASIISGAYNLRVINKTAKDKIYTDKIIVGN